MQFECKFLQMHLQNLGYSVQIKIEIPKSTYCRRLTMSLQLNGNFSSLYLLNETRYRQSGVKKQSTFGWFFGDFKTYWPYLLNKI